MSDLGQRIKNRRTELEWTLADLSTQSGLSKGFLSDLENGNRKTANSSSLAALSKALSVSTDFLISGDRKMREASVQLDFPGSLATFAQEEGLSFAHTAMLLQLRKQILAFRSESKSEDLDEFDWKPFYEAVKEHLK
jgi:transcriptional regulator with XRE-family HTH domain